MNFVLVRTAKFGSNTPRIIAADATIAMIVVEVIVVLVEGLFIIVFVIFLLFIFVLRSMLPSYGNKNRDKFQVRIPSLDSKIGIEQPIFISSFVIRISAL
jgi:Flp pilus assembly protein TadB